ncbi:MAG: hypothetical protein ACI84D_000673 [Thalassolituus oleivorans]|jgi:hypothetical protein
MTRQPRIGGKKVLALLVVCLLAPSTTHAQKIGASLEVYPAGAIVTARYSRDMSDNSRLLIHLGMNATDRRDWGEHEIEEGAGFGAGIAQHRYFSDSRVGPWLGIRADVWAQTIKWQDQGRRGETNVTVIQPTARAGWTLPAFGAQFDFSVSLGAEFNVKTTGESVRQGAIVLVGIVYDF